MLPFEKCAKSPAERRATFLERIGEEIESLGDDLLATANIETALPIAERLAASAVAPSIS